MLREAMKEADEDGNDRMEVEYALSDLAEALEFQVNLRKVAQPFQQNELLPPDAVYSRFWLAQWPAGHHLWDRSVNRPRTLSLGGRQRCQLTLYADDIRRRQFRALRAFLSACDMSCLAVR